MLASFAVLFAAGGLVGVRRQSPWRWIAIGSTAGALVVYAWVLVHEPTPDVDGFRNGVSSAIAAGLILAAGFVVPGYLFGRSYRRSGESTDSSADVADSGGEPVAPSEPSVRSMMTGGCLILLLDMVVILKFLSTPPGP